ncbi:DUF7094 domain-containing protein [Salinibaculum rarum]|uniref:DUF7094 domain-containing protein n=1 Tax=Salinibaculum rarum TaxID=3058903 RepID=UPI0026605664|nr:hypothetical protein [Salinibaculum sp. KK48]
MSRTPLLIALVALALAVLSVGAAGQAPPVVVEDSSPSITDEQPSRVADVPNTTNYLFPNDDAERQAYVRADVDVGSAVAASATRLEGEHRAVTLERRLASQPDTDGQRAVVEQAVSDAEAERSRLDTAHESLYRAYSDGSLSRQQFLRGLVRLEVQATQHRALVGALQTTAETELGSSLPPLLDTRLASLQTGVVTLPSPLSDRIRAAAVGTGDPLVVYTQGAGDALVLATVDGQTFRRQATLLGEHQPDAPDQFETGDQQAIVQVVDRTTDLYPWAYSNDQQFSRRVESAGPSTSIYRIQADHPQGSLSSYLSGSTTNAFHEVQTLDPTEVPVYRTVQNETDTLNLTVTTTTVTGPMRVQLSSPDGGSQNGTVLIDGQPVGTTGSDGILWTVRPTGTFELTAVDETGTEVTLAPTRFVRPS